MFDNANFQALEASSAIRYLVPYDWYKNSGQSAEVKGFMERAAAPPAPTCWSTSRLVAVATTTAATRSARSAARRASRPTSRRSSASAASYPSVQDVRRLERGATTSRSRRPRSPKLAAKYFLAARSVCRSLQDRRRRRARLRRTWSRWLSDVQALRQGQGADLGPAQLRRRQPQAHLAARATCCGKAPGEVWLTETGGILKFLPQLPALRDAPGERDEVHVQAGPNVRLAPRGLRGRDHAALQLPVDRRAAQRPLRRRPREPERHAAQGLQAVFKQKAKRCKR